MNSGVNRVFVVDGVQIYLDFAARALVINSDIAFTLSFDDIQDMSFTVLAEKLSIVGYSEEVIKKVWFLVYGIDLARMHGEYL